VKNPLAPALALLGGFTLFAQGRAPAVDAAFASFFEARGPQETAAASDRIVATGIEFDEAFRRLKDGRAYSRDAARGIVQKSHRSETGEYFYTLDVPAGYDSAKKYQLRVQLHGGVGRMEANTPARSGVNVQLRGAEQIYLMPHAWRDAPWWSSRQVENLRTILDLVKRTYNVDENRVVISGVSDGGTGAYYMAMRDTTPFASVLPLNGFMLVLENETAADAGDLFPNNLRNKPLFIVNGGRDPVYPASVIEPSIDQLTRAGFEVVYRPQANAAHDTSWWPDVKDTFEQFVAAHPRRPLPDALSWESGPPNIPSRAHWLVIERLRAGRPDEPALPDVNRMTATRTADFGIRASGTRINRVVNGSNADRMGLRSGDVVLAINSQPASPATDLTDVLRGYPSGRQLLLSVRRGDASLRLAGRYEPAAWPAESPLMFSQQQESGRVDLTRNANRIEASCRGVAAFRLLLSPDQFDLDRAVTVAVNGRTVFDGIVRKDLRTLLEWAARDNDRTMLFAAELAIEVP
jgi:predicted esterase